MPQPSRSRVRAFLRQMTGEEPSETAIDNALRGYRDQTAEMDALSRNLDDQRRAEFLQREFEARLKDVLDNPPKPS